MDVDAVRSLVLLRLVSTLTIALTLACSGRIDSAAEAEAPPEHERDSAAGSVEPSSPPSNDDHASTEAALQRLCAVMATIVSDRERTVRERIDAIRRGAGPDEALLDDLLEGADSWARVQARIEARGVADFQCAPMEDFVTMVMAGRDDTASTTKDRLAREIDELCALAGRVVGDATITEGRLGAWVQRAAEQDPSASVSAILEQVASMGRPDPQVLHEALAQHARPNWSCPAIEELFAR